MITSHKFLSVGFIVNVCLDLCNLFSDTCCCFERFVWLVLQIGGKQFLVYTVLSMYLCFKSGES